MKKFTHVREKDFKKFEFEYEDEIVEVAENLRKIATEQFENVLPVILCNDEGNKLKFSINNSKNRIEEDKNHLYRITIEKI